MTGQGHEGSFETLLKSLHYIIGKKGTKNHWLHLIKDRNMTQGCQKVNRVMEQGWRKQ